MEIISIEWSLVLWGILNVAILLLVVFLIYRYFKKRKTFAIIKLFNKTAPNKKWLRLFSKPFINYFFLNFYSLSTSLKPFP